MVMNLHLKIPIGHDNILCFNAHRIYKPSTIVDELYDLKLESFSYIKNGKIYNNVDVYKYSENEGNLCGLLYLKNKPVSF